MALLKKKKESEDQRAGIVTFHRVALRTDRINELTECCALRRRAAGLSQKRSVE